MDANELLIRLADGEYHSGERLGAAAGLTRAAVWKQIRKLEKWGLNIETSSGRGYRDTENFQKHSSVFLRAKRQLEVQNHVIPVAVCRVG